MEKKLCISLIFSNFVASKHEVIIFHAMHVDHSMCCFSGKNAEQRGEIL